MYRNTPHHHPCGHCQARTECCGDIEQNYDGFPPFICREYQQYGADFLCEDCSRKYELGTCDDCGAWVGEPHDETCHPGVMHAPKE